MKTVATIAELVRYLTEYDPYHHGSIIDQYYAYGYDGLEAFYDDTLDAIDNGEVEFKFDIMDEGEAVTFISHEGVVRVTQNGMRGLNVCYESNRYRNPFTQVRDMAM